MAAVLISSLRKLHSRNNHSIHQRRRAWETAFWKKIHVQWNDHSIHHWRWTMTPTFMAFSSVASSYLILQSHSSFCVWEGLRERCCRAEDKQLCSPSAPASASPVLASSSPSLSPKEETTGSFSLFLAQPREPLSHPIFLTRSDSDRISQVKSYLQTLSISDLLFDKSRGAYYWKRASRKEEIKVKMMVAEDGNLMEILVRGDDQQVEQMRKELKLSEKGMVYVKGIFERWVLDWLQSQP